MKKECGYCRKPVEAGKKVKRTLLYFCGNNLSRKAKEYCSKQCAEKRPDGTRSVISSPVICK